MTVAPLPAEILDFWLVPRAGEAPPKPTDDPCPARAVWFGKDAAFDGEVRDRFGTAIAEGIAGGYGGWCTSARGSLARVLLLDQFTRNAFRDSATAYAGDERALATAELAIARGFDRQLDANERRFLYMPFQHAESLAMQQRAVALFTALASDSGLASPLRWATRHREVVERFGRFPHRNALLGRASTREEIDFLMQPGSRF